VADAAHFSPTEMSDPSDVLHPWRKERMGCSGQELGREIDAQFEESIIFLY